MRTSFKLTLASALLAAWTLPAVAATTAPTDKQAQKVVKTLLTAIRYKKNNLAAKQLAFQSMVEGLMGPTWKTMSASDQQELTKGLETILRKVSFEKGREMFKHLDAVLYDHVQPDGERARLKTTVVVFRNYKKAEIVIDFVLTQEGGAWKVIDTVMVGESTLEVVREDEIEPLLEEGGVPAVMQALRAKVKEIA